MLSTHFEGRIQVSIPILSLLFLDMTKKLENLEIEALIDFLRCFLRFVLILFYREFMLTVSKSFIDSRWFRF